MAIYILQATVEITSRYNGVIKAVHFGVGDMAPTGSALLDIEVEGDVEDPVTTEAAPKAEAVEVVAAAPAASVGAADASAPARVEPDGQVFATPAVRRIAREHSIDLATVPGSGKDGRVTKDDILAFVSGDLAPRSSAGGAAAPPTSGAAPPAAAAAAAAPLERLPLPTFGIPEDDVRPIKGLQRSMAKVMNGAYPPPSSALPRSRPLIVLYVCSCLVCAPFRVLRRGWHGQPDGPALPAQAPGRGPGHQALLHALHHQGGLLGPEAVPRAERGCVS